MRTLAYLTTTLGLLFGACSLPAVQEDSSELGLTVLLPYPHREQLEWTDFEVRFASKPDVQLHLNNAFGAPGNAVVAIGKGEAWEGKKAGYHGIVAISMPQLRGGHRPGVFLNALQMAMANARANANHPNQRALIEAILRARRSFGLFQGYPCEDTAISFSSVEEDPAIDLFIKHIVINKVHYLLFTVGEEVSLEDDHQVFVETFGLLE